MKDFCKSNVVPEGAQLILRVIQVMWEEAGEDASLRDG
jgi:hypothetical protein